ncbi:uncharacterized protein LY89DRAFT_789921 [Mollisia scopiformis]|uniref:Uncharacterized protein n=1 Tax=Mollisia scopiformis TaxID=149040 RepID=A0A132B415_MOLSC|nr:uncharacterized protein LY89DRAFT_789921 [Mollisia scopiformis]KUJ07126.1 hypothetical protein LY89DRAFT_789921 [Mollisia scopiformis]
MEEISGYISRPVSPISDGGEGVSVTWENLKVDEGGMSQPDRGSLALQLNKSLKYNPGDPQHLGFWNISIIAFGSLYVIFLLGFLWFLWGGHEDIPFWRWLVVQGYVQRAVTLCATILRIVVAAQSSLGVSMLAALVIESAGSALKRSTALSLQRFLGGTPFTLMELRLLTGIGKVISALIVLLSSTTIGAYFTSTALISDFALLSILGYPVQNEFLYSLNNVSTLGSEPIYSNNRPTSYPAFAEFSTSVEVNQSDSTQEFVDDTGPTLRAFLPLSADIRQNVGSYNGIGTLLNSHVVCVRPVIQNLTYTMQRTDVSNDFKSFISGSISLESMPEGLDFDQLEGENNLQDFPYEGYGWGPTLSLNFSCQMTLPSIMATGEWPISMCVAGNMLNSTGATLSDMGRLPTLGLRATSLLNDNVLFDPLSYVLVNYCGLLPNVYDVAAPPKIEPANWTEIASSSPTWRTFTQKLYGNFTYVSLSYCFSHFAAIDAQISVNSSTPRAEPMLSKSNTSNTPFDATDVLRQLGADGVNRSLNDRGILSLSKDEKWPSYTDTKTSLALDGSYGFGMQRNAFSPPHSGKLDSEYLIAYGDAISGTWGLCSGCLQDENDGSSLKASGRVAIALQALFTVVNMMQYYDRLPQFDLEAPISISTFSPKIQPKHRMGLLFVTIGLLIHIATMIAITTIFHFRTKNPFIGQSWHTVAQLQNENMIPILEKASLMRDNEVESMMREEGMNGDEVFYMDSVVEVGGEK